MRQRIPIPKLAKQYHPHNSTHIPTPSTALQANRRIASAGVDQALSQSRTESSHGIFVLVGDGFGVEGADGTHV